MRGFTKPIGETVSFTRGAETIEITFYPLPMGYRVWLQAAYPIPVKFVNGKAADSDPGAVNEWNDLATLLMIARSAAAGTFETELPPAGSDPTFYKVRAERIRQEIRDAHLTDGDVRAMWAVVNRLSTASTVESRLRTAEGN